ncbi:hypothetical protein V5799_032334 [Amblyomma americanum]|uniref:Uncharacterized protein n=1 Tax=Amblyomma americanum TaxID=6943 RepID=A0AAQ4DRG5_AMBAM
MATFVKGRTLFRYSVAFFWAMALWVYSTLASLGNLVFGTRFHQVESAYNALLAESPLCPQLFLYSEKDAICSHQSIHAFADARRAKGVPVEEVFWQDSPHVQHFILHRNQYITSVTDFMRRCLQGTIQVSSPVGKKDR